MNEYEMITGTEIDGKYYQLQILYKEISKEAYKKFVVSTDNNIINNNGVN